MPLKVALVLREARRQLGFTQREMARRVGVSLGTLSKLERGHGEPSHRDLEGYLRIVPGLRAADLLLVPDRTSARADEASWRAWRDAIGHVVPLAFVSVDARGMSPVETRSLRGMASLTPDGVQLLDLMQGALTAPASLWPPAWEGASPSRAFSDGRFVHSFRVRRGRRAFDYVRRGRVEGEAVASYEVAQPIERLRLHLRTAHARGAPILRAWPMFLGYDPSWDVASALHPGVTRRRGQVVEATIDRPAVGLRYALTWSEEAAAPRPPREARLADRLRSLRHAHGLSMRDACRRLGLRKSHVSIRNAEKGGAVRHSLLRAYLTAFPELAACDLLDQGPRPVATPGEAAWWHAHDVHGLSAELLSRTIVIAPDGRARVTVRVVRLRRHRQGGADLRFRHGETIGLYQPMPITVAAILGVPEQAVDVALKDADPRARGRELRITNAPLHEGLTITMEGRPAPLYSLYASRVRDALGPGPHHEGTSAVVRYPCRRLRVDVTFPLGFEPPAVFRDAAPWRVRPEIGQPSGAHPGVTRLSTGRDRRGALRATLLVEHPIVGLKYGIAWEMA